MGRRAPFCAFCTLLAIFPLKVCVIFPIDIFLNVWYNIIVVKRGTPITERMFAMGGKDRNTLRGTKYTEPWSEEQKQVHSYSQ